MTGTSEADPWRQRFERERAARKEAERLLDDRSRALWEANQALASRADELSASLERLEQVRETLVEQEKLAALGGLVAGVAHEINTPLGVGLTALSHAMDRLTALEAASTAGTLTRGQLRGHLAELREALDLTRANLERGAALVRSFKMVAVDQASSELRAVDVPTLVRDILASVRPMLRDAGVIAEVTGDAAVPVVLAAGAFIQIVTNLVQNACLHAFPVGAAAPSVQLDLADLGPTLRVVVRDNGCGMDADTRARVFEPFFTTRRGQGGSGLGMHIVHNLIVSVFEGAITCDAAPGGGTRWCLNLPFGTPALRREAGQAPAA